MKRNWTQSIGRAVEIRFKLINKNYASSRTWRVWVEMVFSSARLKLENVLCLICSRIAGEREAMLPSEGNFNYVTFVLFSIHCNNEARRERGEFIWPINLADDINMHVRTFPWKSVTRKNENFNWIHVRGGDGGGGKLKAVKQSQHEKREHSRVVMAENF